LLVEVFLGHLCSSEELFIAEIGLQFGLIETHRRGLRLQFAEGVVASEFLQQLAGIAQPLPVLVHCSLGVRWHLPRMEVAIEFWDLLGFIQQPDGYVLFSVVRCDVDVVLFDVMHR